MLSFYREREQTARAVAASIADVQRKGHINMVDESFVPFMQGASGADQTSKESSRDTKFQESKQDFPTLDGKIVNQESLSDEDSAKDPGYQGRDSMAKKVARANNFSVADGSLDTDDFPTLGGGPMGAAGAQGNQAWAMAPGAEDFPALGGGRAKLLKSKQPFPSQPNQNNWAVKQSVIKSKSAPPKTTMQPNANSMRDFPSLSSIGSNLAKSKPVAQRDNFDDVPKSYDEPKSYVQTSNVSVIRPDDEQISMGKIAAVINKPVKLDKTDFPTLGGSQVKSKQPAQQPVQWGPKQKETEKVEEPPPKQESQFMVAKLKNKNKKKKNKGGLESGSESSASSLSGDLEKKNNSGAIKSLEKSEEVKSAVDSDSDSKKNVSSSASPSVKKKSKKDSSLKAKDSSSSSEQPKSGKNKKKADTNSKENDSRYSPVSTAKDSSAQDVSVPEVKSLAGPSVKSSNVPTNNDDYPALTTLKDQSNLQEKVSSQVSSLQLDDFPSLGSSVSAPSSSAAPPPGFSKAAKAPPPGFGAPAKTSTAAAPKPPPGFGSISSSLVVKSDAPRETKEEEIQEVPEKDESTAQQYEFVQPPDFMQRNVKLISSINEYLNKDEDKFNDFKKSSGQFRTGSIGPYDYYSKCSTILGKDNFKKIFPELLALLPDITKQRELLTAHNSAMKLSMGKKSGKKGQKMAAWSTGEQLAFSLCSVCGQVLLKNDYVSHMKEHNMDSDFPSLGASNSAPGSTYGMSAWVRAK